MTNHDHDQDQDQKLDAMLETLGGAEAPAGFANSVMNKVSQTRIGDTHDTLLAKSKIIPWFSNGGIVMTVTKKAMWGLAAAAAVILVVFVARGGFPTVDRTEGAIGAAKKYQAPQIAANDVTTGDASVQEFLQSDEFDRLLKDPEALSLFRNATMRDALSQAGFADAIRNDKVRSEMQSGMLHQIFSDAQARAFLHDAMNANIQANARNADLNASLHNIRAVEARNALDRALNDANLWKAIINRDLQRVMDNSKMRETLARADVKVALNNAAVLHALNRTNFDAAIHSNAFEAALNRQ
jgi:hypothetical protein